MKVFASSDCILFPDKTLYKQDNDNDRYQMKQEYNVLLQNKDKDMFQIKFKYKLFIQNIGTKLLQL